MTGAAEAASARAGMRTLASLRGLMRDRPLIPLLLLLLLLVAMLELIRPGIVNQLWLANTVKFAIPLAILALQQGLGRLIRHRQDRGVLAILDPRLRTMGYGRRFLASLPPAPVTHHVDDVERFFDGV